MTPARLPPRQLPVQSIRLHAARRHPARWRAHRPRPGRWHLALPALLTLLSLGVTTGCSRTPPKAAAMFEPQTTPAAPAPAPEAKPAAATPAESASTAGTPARPPPASPAPAAAQPAPAMAPAPAPEPVMTPTAGPAMGPSEGPLAWGKGYETWSKATGYIFSRAHGGRLVLTYANSADVWKIHRSNATLAREGDPQGYQTYPVGAVLAMPSWDLDTAGSPGPLGPVFFMRKEKPGYNPPGGDWRYAMTRPDLSVIAQGTGGPVTACQTCHAQAQQRDFVPATDR